ncbi:methyltransferase [Hydrogenophaga sp. SNF1]|uniref:methyltransferase n=1 Tax=Hydrogenophaga sp. SNF1 TaxID=3098762 RepID=UPI002ACBDCF3|nr:methyltransferase [Hydrogenophaga sp. SNF1]WQB85549.1 methyltransferase [Hydrogenophaga sp. SNF1]
MAARERRRLAARARRAGRVRRPAARRPGARAWPGRLPPGLPGAGVPERRLDRARAGRAGLAPRGRRAGGSRRAGAHARRGAALPPPAAAPAGHPGRGRRAARRGRGLARAALAHAGRPPAAPARAAAAPPGRAPALHAHRELRRGAGRHPARRGGPAAPAVPRRLGRAGRGPVPRRPRGQGLQPTGARNRSRRAAPTAPGPAPARAGGGRRPGGTTAWLAPALPAGRCDYLFTDVGPSMVARAKEAFAAHRFMAFQALDLEQDLAAQGLDGRRFDLVIASNVVHATADLRRTLGRLRGALAPGGTLLMLEVAGDERWIDITFGLTEGWWRFTDTDLRPRQPLLSRERWLSLLAETGFEAAAIDSPDPRSREVLLAARKPVEALEPMPTGGRWLLLTDQQGVGDALAAGLRGAGQVVDLRPANAATGADAAALRQALAGADWRGVVHLGSLDTSPAPAGAVVPSLRAGLGSLLDLVQAMGATAFATAPRLWIATRGAVAVDGADAVDAAQAPTWGLGKVIALEHPEWRASCVDLDPRADASAMAGGLLRALAAADAEDQVALRGGRRHVARLAPFPLVAADDAPVRLEKAASGVFDDMALRPMARRARARARSRSRCARPA